MIDMSHLWTFSSSSKIHLQRCLAVASYQDNDNKWTRQFKPNAKLYKQSQNLEETIQKTDNKPSYEKNIETDITDTYDDFIDTIEAEPTRFDPLDEEILKNNTLIFKLAERLSESAVEKIFERIFNHDSVNNLHLEILFKKFFPVYLKRNYTRFPIDLLIQINKMYPEIFKTLLELLLNDLEVSNAVLNDFALVLNENEKSQFVKNLTDIELSTKTFIHNIFTIYTAYKDCLKTDRVQNYILTNLAKHGSSCSKDRNYGRLFLTFLQAEKASKRRIDFPMIQDLLEKHMSPFKRPCTIILNNMMEAQI